MVIDRFTALIPPMFIIMAAAVRVVPVEIPGVGGGAEEGNEDNKEPHVLSGLSLLGLCH
jgi:hypothetical protein